MIRVLFIWPPKIEYIFSIQKHYTNFGETIAYLDCNTEIDVDVMDGSALQHFQWDFISAYSNEYDFLIVYTDLHNSIAAIKSANLCKKISPKTVTISYGQGTPYAPEVFLEQGFDVAIIDPMFQKSIKDFIFFKWKKLSQVELSGVYFKQDNSIVKIPVKSELLVEKIGFPALDKIPVDQYKKISGSDQLCFTVAKGCPYPCRFCRVPIDQGKIVSYRPVQDTINYLKLVIKNYASINLIAPTFTVNRDWVIEFCEAIENNQLKFNWVVTTRLELLDEDLIRIMAHAGCITIAFGLETLYLETQSAVDKYLPVSLVQSNVEMLKKYGVIPKAFIMLGIPGQSKEEIEDTYKFLKENQIEIRPKEYYPYELLKTAENKMELLAKFEREDVYNKPIPNVTPLQFVKWLIDRTDVR